MYGRLTDSMPAVLALAIQLRREAMARKDVAAVRHLDLQIDSIRFTRRQERGRA